MSDMPRFMLVGDPADSTDAEEVNHWDAVRKVFGKDILFHQYEGSCVWQGLAGAETDLQCIEILRGDWDELKLPSMPHGYGWVRNLSGLRSVGHGAHGAGAAKAATTKGMYPADGELLPKPTLKDEGHTVDVSWGAKLETKYSVIRDIPVEANQLAEKHLIKTAASMRSFDDVVAAIKNGYPVTIACSRGFQMQARKDGDKLWGVPSGTWNHQTRWRAVTTNPKRPGAFLQNSWGTGAHGKPVNQDPHGGFWIDADVVDWMIRDGEAFAFSGGPDFPRRKLDWTLVG